MRKIAILLLVLLSHNLLKSQSLSPERVKKIKDATVRITIDGMSDVGTGFFVNENGWVLTCLHVIRPALIVPKDSAFHKIFIHLNNGEQYEVGIPIPLLNNEKFENAAISFDFCYLIIKSQPNTKFSFLNIGSFADLNEGDDVYTCGYPLGIEQQFISRGIASTKYIDTINVINNGKVVSKTARNQALLDLTLNRGNSGGAIVKIGNSIQEDKVVGIADFIIIPFGEATENLYKQSQNTNMDIEMGGISTMKTYQLFSLALANASNGISGCVSIDHFLQAFDTLQKQQK